MNPAVSFAVGASLTVAGLSALAHPSDMPVAGVNANAHASEGATSTMHSTPAELSRPERSDPTSRARRHVKPRRPAPTPASRSSVRPALPSPPTAARGGRPTSAQWEHLRNCEAGGNYATDTGNGYYGAYQFDLSTWHATLDRIGVTFAGLPSDAPPSLQDRAAQALYDDRGRAPWPHCGPIWLP